MPVSAAERDYLLAQVDRLAQTDLNNLWRQAESLATVDFFTYVRAAFPEIVDVYHQTAGQLAATWFEQSNPESSYVAQVVEPIVREQLLSSAEWALGGDGTVALDRMSGTLQRGVYNGARDTVVLNAEATGSRWIRVARPTACEFCRLLATKTGEDAYTSRRAAEVVVGRRGRPRSEKKTARKLGEKYHDFCHCQAVEVRATQTVDEVLNDEQRKLFRQWTDEYEKAVANAGTTDTKKLLAAWRENIALGDGVVAQAGPNRQQLLLQLAEADDLPTIKSIAEQLQPNIEFVLNPKATIGQSEVAIDHVKSTVRAVDDVITKYPNMKVKQIKFEKGDGLEYAYARLNTLDQSNGAELINMNSAWMTNPKFSESYVKSVNDGFHYPGKPWYRKGDDTSAYAVATHELGHVMNWNSKVAGRAGQNGADWVVDDALMDYFVKTYKVDPSSFDDLNLFKYWKRHNLSGYSFEGSDVNAREALAEAFADVEVNGDSAYETSKVLHHLLVEYYKGNEFSQDFEWPDFRPADKLNPPIRPRIFEVFDNKILERAKQFSLRSDDA